MTLMSWEASLERSSPLTVLKALAITSAPPTEVIEESMSIERADPPGELPARVPSKNNLTLSTGTLLSSLLCPKARPVTSKLSFVITEEGASTWAMILSVVTEGSLAESHPEGRRARPRSAIPEASSSMCRMGSRKRGLECKPHSKRIDRGPLVRNGDGTFTQANTNLTRSWLSSTSISNVSRTPGC